MGIIDTHTHLDSYARRGDLPATLQRAAAAGLESVVAIGTDTDDWTLNRELAQKNPGVVHYTVGLHPCNVGADWAERVAQLEAFWGGGARPPDALVGQKTRPEAAFHPVALGETGLDRFHLPKDPAEAEKVMSWQKAAFTAQLALTKKLGCPLVVHSRNAFAECVAMIDSAGVDWRKVVFHCFSEGPAEMAELVQRGGYGSFTGVVTYKNADSVRAALLAQGLNRLMIETDAPWLAPTPHRGKPNEPAYLRHTADYCATLCGVSYERLAEVTTGNAKRFYGLTT